MYFYDMKHRSLIALLKEHREEILRIAALYGARNVRVFGSVARGEDDEQSDVDILVDLEDGRSILDLGGFLYDVQELLGCNVDVVTERSIRSANADAVLEEALAI